MKIKPAGKIVVSPVTEAKLLRDVLLQGTEYKQKWKLINKHFNTESSTELFCKEGKERELFVYLIWALMGPTALNDFFGKDAEIITLVDHTGPKKINLSTSKIWQFMKFCIGAPLYKAGLRIMR